MSTFQKIGFYFYHFITPIHVQYTMVAILFYQGYISSWWFALPLRFCIQMFMRTKRFRVFRSYSADYYIDNNAKKDTAYKYEVYASYLFFLFSHPVLDNDGDRLEFDLYGEAEIYKECIECTHKSRWYNFL